MRVLGVSGSLRADSYNTSLLAEASAAAPAGVEVELVDPALIAELPIYDQDLDLTGDVPASVHRLREVWAGADAILFATPEYNGSVPGGLKNAVDWASRPRGEAALLNRTVAVVGASAGQFGAIWAQNDLRRILGIAGARVVGEGLPVARAHEGFTDETRTALREVLQLLVEAASLDEVAA
ncbi:MAG: NAD(P)H-dependent oxidoreductase [Actinomycetota bacterium]